MRRRCPETEHGEIDMEPMKRLGKTLLGAGLAVALGFAITAGNQAVAQT